MNFETIIFDYDGTLHESINIYAPAFRRAQNYLVENGLLKNETYTDQEISKWLGYSSKDMWDSFMPNLEPEIKECCSKLIGDSMKLYIKEGKANLYKDALEILELLKKSGYKLIFLSNCKIAYMEAHKAYFNLEKYFDRFYCTEQFSFIPKYEIFDHIKSEIIGECVVVGDRFQDIEIAKKHNLMSIGCIYGYGNLEELKEATWKIGSILEIKKILDLDKV